MSKTKSEKRFGTAPITPVQNARKRILKHLRNHPEGVSTAQLHAWIDTVRSGGVIGMHDFHAALAELKRDDTATSTNDLWHARGAFREPAPSPPIDSRDLPEGGLFERFRRGSGT